jgi:FkbM family methyltransferase
MTKIDVFGAKFEVPEGVILKRDLATQLPVQSYALMWSRFIKPGDVVFDVGAYIGLISIHFAAMGARVHAFEGSLRNTARLTRMAAAAPGPDISIHAVALSDRNYECRTRFNDCVDREHPEQTISYARLDEYMCQKRIPDPRFVKIDIEGMETVALKGMSRLIREVRPVWQIECHTGLPFKYDNYPGYVSVEDGGFDFAEFHRAGYAVLDERGKRIRTKDMVCFNNYFFVSSKIL